MNRLAIACGQLALLDRAEPLQFDPDEGERRKIEGQALALENAGSEWKSQALEIVRQVALRHAEFTSDETRAAAEAAGIVEPPSANAWGGIFFAAARAGFCQRTDTVRPSNRTAAHRHHNTVWRSLLRAS